MAPTKVSVGRLFQSMERFGHDETVLDCVVPDEVWLHFIVAKSFTRLFAKTPVTKGLVLDFLLRGAKVVSSSFGRC
jgi:hypothetical protein